MGESDREGEGGGWGGVMPNYTHYSVTFLNRLISVTSNLLSTC